jgi:transcriptional regulator with XRE-family HTH domain
MDPQNFPSIVLPAEISRLRKGLDLLQSELALIIGVSESLISYLEAGQRFAVDPYDVYLSQASRIFDAVAPDWAPEDGLRSRPLPRKFFEGMYWLEKEKALVQHALEQAKVRLTQARQKVALLDRRRRWWEGIQAEPLSQTTRFQIFGQGFTDRNALIAQDLEEINQNDLERRCGYLEKRLEWLGIE